MFVKAANNQVEKFPYTVGDLRRDNPNTAFPKTIPLETMSAFGMYPVSYEDAPEYDKLTQRVENASQPILVEGSWVLPRNIVALTQDQVDGIAATAANRNRKKRNDLLSKTDFYALTDVTLSAEMTSYRQQLRDITTHASWPHLTDDDWPVKPE